MIIMTTIIMDGGLSHIKCGKSNFIFVFSNNNIDKKCLWKVSILYCGPEIDVSVWKINKINWIVIWLVFTVSLHFYFPEYIYINASMHVYIFDLYVSMSPVIYVVIHQSKRHSLPIQCRIITGYLWTPLWWILSVEIKQQDYDHIF